MPIKPNFWDGTRSHFGRFTMKPMWFTSWRNHGCKLCNFELMGWNSAVVQVLENGKPWDQWRKKLPTWPCSVLKRYGLGFSPSSQVWSCMRICRMLSKNQTWYCLSTARGCTCQSGLGFGTAFLLQVCCRLSMGLMLGCYAADCTSVVSCLVDSGVTVWGHWNRAEAYCWGDLSPKLCQFDRCSRLLDWMPWTFFSGRHFRLGAFETGSGST